MKKLILSLCALFWLSFMWAQNIVRFSGSEAATIGVCIVDLATGKTVISHNAEKVFIPASVMKCITSAAVVESLNPSESPFTTVVSAYGHIENNVLNGNVVVTGGGDPTLGSRHIGSPSRFIDAAVEWIRGQGIDSIAGDVIVVPDIYPSLGVSPYWLLEDIAWEYGAGLYGFNWHDNSFSMKVSSEGVESVSPKIDGLEIVCDVRKGSRGNVMAMRGEDSYRLYVYGNITGESYSSRYSMPYPHMVFRDVFVDALADSGVGCSEEPIEADELISESPMLWKSPSCDDILRTMMFKSDNLYAEGMLRALTLSGDDHSVDCALAVEKRCLEALGLNLSGMKIADGSGLAVTNRLSPAFLARMLTVMGKGKNAGVYKKLFPIVGKEGTVRSLLAKTRLTGRLALKSGSMSGVLCYAGYKLDSGGRPTHAVVIMVNGFTCKGAEVRRAISNYLLSVF